MDDAAGPPPKKSSTPLSVDRAAFLLLRVKKAFKKKRQQRKEKQSQLGGSAGLTSQHRSSCRPSHSHPHQLLRSRTLPAIIVPGTPPQQQQQQHQQQQQQQALPLDERSVTKSRGGSAASSGRWPLSSRSTAIGLSSNNNNYSSSNNNKSGCSGSGSSNNNNNVANVKSLNLPKDDAGIVYRRKSSGSSPLAVAALSNVSHQFQQQQHPFYQPQTPTSSSLAAMDSGLMPTVDDFECDTDGSLLLRIPAPYVVAARAYRLAGRKPSSSGQGAETRGTIPTTADAQQSSYCCMHDSSSMPSTSSAMGGSSSGSGSSSSTALTRLARLLHQSSSAALSRPSTDHLPSAVHALAPHPSGRGDGEEAPRRLSWERRKDSSALQRSASIDSFAEIVWSDSPRPSLDIPRPAVPFSKRPSASSLFSNCSSSSAQNAQLNINYGDSSGSGGGGGGSGGGGGGGSGGNSRRESLLSPSATRRNKTTRIINDNILPLNRCDRNSCSRTTAPASNSNSKNFVVLRSRQPQTHTSSSSPSSPSSSSTSLLIESSNNNNNNNNNTAIGFRWSEQLTHHVSVAKIRSAISCPSANAITRRDPKEMEFLLPHPPVAKGNSTTSTAAKGSGPGPHEAMRNGSSSSATSGLMVSRQPRSSVQESKADTDTKQQPQQQALSLVITSIAKHAKLHAEQKDASGCPDENDDGNANHQSRDAVNGRHKSGNTPHRTKMSKKQLKLAQAQSEKLTQINLHLHALFSAVEHGHLDKARTILESTDVDVNSINTDGLSALDVAVLSNNRSMTRMLLQHGAMEAAQYSSNDSIGTKLNGLLKDAESRIHDLSGSTESGLACPSQSAFTSRPSISSIIIGNTSSSVTGCTGNEIDKQIGIWERRVKALRRMLLGWDQARPPDAPASVTVDVTGDTSVVVQILEPFEGAIATKFKVQWSTRADFSNVVGEREIAEWSSYHGTMGAHCQVYGLTQGRRYFVRATCGNVKGWGPYKTSVPSSVIPSSWRDLSCREDRVLDQQCLLDNLFTAVRLARPADVSELSLDSNNVQRRNPKKKTTIKQLFSVASKFQKTLRRGIYLASVIYCDDKVLVTSEDFLPVIEIDETYPGTLHSDYHWLMKIACTWEDVKSLRTDMERNLTSAVHFRTKLLSAICQMQSALGITDLGQLFYRPLRDSHGTVVLTCIQAVRSQKTVSILNSRWLPVSKLQKKIGALHEDYNISEILISSIGEQMHYHQSSMQRLSPGLYLGYLKMQCSVEQIQVVVPMKTPNVLPHCRVRDNNHISAEEWQVLKRRGGGDKRDGSNGGGGGGSGSLGLALELGAQSEGTSEVQRLFLYDLTSAAHRLFSYMNVRPEDAATHRLYDVEVIEHSREISFLIICPSVELTCAMQGQSDILLQRDDLASLSIQAFEMIHLRTYQPGIMQKYARLSCILELDTALANHSHREAFSTSELQTAKERLSKLQELTASLNVVWKSVRWLMDVIAFARDKNAQSSVPMQEILNFANVVAAAGDEMGRGNAESGSGGGGGGVGVSKKQLLQLPIREVKFTKSGSGRGSWPGPAGSCHPGGSNALEAEHSKSEQNLGVTAITPTSATSLAPPQMTYSHGQNRNQQLLQVSNDLNGSNGSMRKNSGDSVTSQYTTSHSFYSVGAGSALSSNNELSSTFAMPSSRSADTLALATGDYTQFKQPSLGPRKRTTSSNVPRSTTAAAVAASAPMITVHSSSSAPYLVCDASKTGSSLSLRNPSTSSSTTDYDSRGKIQGSDQSLPAPAVKAASSTNIRDGGLYLKTTLTALQSHIKDTTISTTSCSASSAVSAAAPATATSKDESSMQEPRTTSVSKTSSGKSLSRQSSEEDTASCSSQASEQAAASGSSGATSGIIQVYTAYHTGLATGTSLKLHVTPKTSAREVINLVVKQLNMAAVLKGSNGPIYSADKLDNFCLVAVIGARERCLRDDFKPLLLQNPWKKGRLYVRQKHELLAAIEHSNRKSNLI